MLILPRRARDTHKLQKVSRFLIAGATTRGHRSPTEVAVSWRDWQETFLPQVRKRVCLRHFILQVVILPRRLRDKHRESTQKETRLLPPQFHAAIAEAGALSTMCSYNTLCICDGYPCSCPGPSHGIPACADHELLTGAKNACIFCAIFLH